MPLAIGAWERNTQTCGICGNAAMPMIQLDLDGTEQSAIVCALCVAEGLERASGWRLQKMFMQFEASAEVGRIVRQAAPPRRRSRALAPVPDEGDAPQLHPRRMTLQEARALAAQEHVIDPADDESDDVPTDHDAREEDDADTADQS